MDNMWLDCHVHVLGGDTNAVQELVNEQRNTYHRCCSNFLSVEGMDDCAQNALAIYLKLIAPENYIFGGLHHRFDYDAGEETRKLYDIGFDGMKMIENKPSERKLWGLKQDGPEFSRMYEACAALDFPLLIHVNDPAENWDESRVSDWAKQNGYFYGNGEYVSYEQVLQETVSMLEKNPQNRFCLAHLLFLSDNEPRLKELMDRFPNLSLDITAGTEMYYAFDENPAVWRAFFMDYADRIMFGTDNCYPAGDYDRKIAGEINALEEDFLTREDRFPLWDRFIQGAHLPQEAIHKITSVNFRTFTGAKPRKLNKALAKKYLTDRLNNPSYRLSDRERKITETVLSYL